MASPSDVSRIESGKMPTFSWDSPPLRMKGSSEWGVAATIIKNEKMKEFNDPFHGKKGFFHLSTEALKDRLLFRTDEDFKYGVNSLALLVANSNVSLLCYCLMSNHVHLLLSGTWEECRQFMTRYLWRLSLLVARRDGIREILRADDYYPVAVTSIEQFRREVAYILRNPYKAGIASPISYKWSPVRLYFNPDLSLTRGIPVRSLSDREYRDIFRTRIKLPQDYEFHDGVILEKCFVDYTTVMERFVDSRDFFNHLKDFKTESLMEKEQGLSDGLVFSDSELAARALILCRSEFSARRPELLERKDLLTLARTLHRRFGAGIAQLARVLSLPEEFLQQVL